MRPQSSSSLSFTVNRPGPHAAGVPGLWQGGRREGKTDLGSGHGRWRPDRGEEGVLLRNWTLFTVQVGKGKIAGGSRKQGTGTARLRSVYLIPAPAGRLGRRSVGEYRHMDRVLPRCPGGQIRGRGERLRVADFDVPGTQMRAERRQGPAGETETERIHWGNISKQEKMGFHVPLNIGSATRRSSLKCL